jgi:hypothetical protein
MRDSVGGAQKSRGKESSMDEERGTRMEVEEQSYLAAGRG